MKRMIFIICFVFFAMGGCNQTQASNNARQNIEPSAVSSVTPIKEFHIEPTSTDTWRYSNDLDRFIDMAVLPDYKVWAVSHRGTVIQDYLEFSHLVNRYIKSYGFYLNSINFVSPDDGWMTGAFGQIFHWDGKEWKSVIKLGWERNISLYDVAFADKDDGWAVGCDFTESHPAKYKVVLLKWDGNDWENVSLLGDIGRDNFCLKSIDVVSPINVWAVGEEFYAKGVTLHWDGSKWHEIPSPKEMHYAHSISATSEDNVWVNSSNSIEYEDIFHWNGQNWSQVQLPVSMHNSDADKTSAILAVSQDDVWVGGRMLFHWEGSSWKNMNYGRNEGDIVDIDTTPDGKVWALTDVGAILQLGK